MARYPCYKCGIDVYTGSAHYCLAEPDRFIHIRKEPAGVAVEIRKYAYGNKALRVSYTGV